MVEVPMSAKEAREEAYQQVSPEFSGKDKRDIVFLLTLVNLTDKALGNRPNIHEYLQYASTHQGELLSLAREFDDAIDSFNKTAGRNIDPKLVNTIFTRDKNKMGKNGILPQLLGGDVRPHEALSQFRVGDTTLAAQNKYMKNSEMAEGNPELLKLIMESGEWSRIHLTAKDAKHFLAMLLIDVYPGMLRRYFQETGGYKELDTDELVRALCESLDPKSEFFGLIKDQGWLTEEEFSKGFIDSVKQS